MKTHLLILLALTASTQAQNLICNGDFESPRFPGTNAQGPLPCWRAVAGENIELHTRRGNFVDGVHGMQYSELDIESNGGIYQDIATLPGQHYLVSFFIANRKGSPESAVRLEWDGIPQVRATRVQPDFQLVTREVLATKDVSRLALIAVGPSDTLGDLVDDVSVVPIPGPGSVQGYTYYFPQFVEGGPWTSTLSLVNASPYFGNQVTYFVYGDNESDPSRDATQILNLGGSASIVSPASNQLRTGWVRVLSSEPLIASIILRQSVPGRIDQEATVLARQPVTEFVAPFDNATNFVTGAAFVDVSGAPITLTFTFTDSAGIPIGTGTLPLARFAHVSFTLPSQFPITTGRSGSLSVKATDANGEPAPFVPLGLRFTPDGAFTTLPY